MNKYVMKNQIGSKIRKIRELKGLSQEYMSSRLSISQRSYSKLEREEIKLDWQRINEIATILEMDPIDLVSFDDSLVFHNCTQSGKAHTIYNQYPEELKQQYEQRIAHLEEEIVFLREQLARRI